MVQRYVFYLTFVQPTVYASSFLDTCQGYLAFSIPDTSKTAASWFGACIFLIVAATILRSFFL